MALNVLMTSGYEALRCLAGQLIMDESEDECLLIHDAYLRFTFCGWTRFKDHQQFFRFFCQIMRGILQERKFCGLEQAPLQWATHGPAEPHADPSRSLMIKRALAEMAEATPRQFKLVYLRFYLGQSRKDIAEALAVSEASVKRLWRKAQKQLCQTLRNADCDLVWRVKKRPLQLDLNPKPLPPLTN